MLPWEAGRAVKAQSALPKLPLLPQLTQPWVQHTGYLPPSIRWMACWKSSRQGLHSQDAKRKGFIQDRIKWQARLTEVRYEDTYSGPKVNASPHDKGRYLRNPEATMQLLTFG